MRAYLFPISILAMVFLAGCSPKMSQHLYNVEVTSYEGSPILLGKINREGLQRPPYNAWFQENYDDYQVDEATLAPVRDKLLQTDIRIFMGTWCSDSQLQVPQFYRILDALGYDEQKISIVSLDNHPDRRKTSPGGEEKGWNIEYVPTFIFLRDGEEMGRIVEYPQEETLEKDVARILGG